MKLSEAILEGVKKYPQVKQTVGLLFWNNLSGEVCACAGGMALLGAGLVTLEQLKGDGLDDALNTPFPHEWNAKLSEEVSLEYGFGGRDIIAPDVMIDLNDGMGFSFEDVAQRLAELGA